MSRYDDEDEPDWDEPGDESAETIDCPHCGAALYEDSERCPRCERYLSSEELPTRRQHPWWILIAALVCLLIVLAWIIRGE
jgi:predicted nucleic acid-binding Zn ribbon protein